MINGIIQGNRTAQKTVVKLQIEIENESEMGKLVPNQIVD